MIQVIKNDVKCEHYFDRKANRHYINGIVSVLHCHHYSSLYTQLAIDSGETELLKSSARDVFREVLGNYFESNPQINTLSAKLDIGCQYFGLMGLGALKVRFLGDNSGEVEMPVSHTDSGWIKKWGLYDKPVNYIGGGFIEALFETVLNASSNTFEAVETQSIVMGAKTSQFKVVRR
jgi:hypothetical protein